MSGQQTPSSSGKATQRKPGVSAIPKGYHAVTPYLIAKGSAAKLIDFMTKAFNARQVQLMKAPDGTVGHAELMLGDSHIMLSDGMGSPHNPGAAMLYLYVDDADATFAQAIKAGATKVTDVMDQFYGDRSGCVKDFAGNLYWIATHIEDVPKDELERRAKESMSKMQQQQKH